MAKSRSESLLFPFLGGGAVMELARGFAQGRDSNAWPGHKTITFRHCEERSDEAILEIAASR